MYKLVDEKPDRNDPMTTKKKIIIIYQLPKIADKITINTNAKKSDNDSREKNIIHNR